MILEGYSNTELLFESGKTLIYRSFHEASGTSQILKIPGTNLSLDKAEVIYESEFNIGEKLNSDLHIKYLGYNRINGTPFLLIEDFGAVSLAQIIPKNGLAIDVFFNYSIKIVNALAELHEKRIIHKDICSSNIVVNTKTDVLKLIDFGSASNFIKELGDNKTVWTQANLAYISPEQTGRINRVVTYKTDFYSLGITFFHMLTGRLPFPSNEPSELIFQHIAADPPHAKEVKPSVPSLIDEIVNKLMNKNSDERYKSALGLLNDLEKALEYWNETKVIPIFELAKNDVSEVFSIPEKLYGREKELLQVKDYFLRAVQGNFTVSYILGASGIGKSAFVSELFKDIVKKKGNFGFGKFDQIQRNVPYSALIQALNQIIQNILIENAESIAAWKMILHENLGQNAGLLATVLPDLEMIMGEIKKVEITDPTLAKNRFILAFKNLIKSFSQSDAPLVLFMDDLQWIDAATLQLFTDLFNDIDPEEKNYTLIIGAYRDNEVGPEHQLSIVLRDFENRGFPKRNIKLNPLDEDAINMLCSEALGRKPEDTKELVSLLYSKTGGSPFFVRQFLENLYARDFIYLDRVSRNWSWRINKIQESGFTDNVVKLIQEKLHKLDSDVKTVLKVASCLGNNFKSSDIAHITRIDESMVDKALIQGMNDDVIYKLNSESEGVYRFQHDRIKTAAYEMIEKDNLEQLQYSIGKYLIQRLDIFEKNTDKLFEALEHLNRTESLVIDTDLRLKMARLNLNAAEIAQQSNAYQAALNFADKGISFMPNSSWNLEMELLKKLHFTGGQSAYLIGEYSKMHQLIDNALLNLVDPVDKAQFHEIVVYSYSSRRQWEEAVEEALKGLGELGLRLPKKPNSLQVMMHVGHLFLTMGRRRPEDLVDLPTLDNSKVEAIHKLFLSAASAAYLTNQNMFAIFFTEMVRLSAKYGNGKHSAFAYIAFGVFYGGALGFINYGYRFGELGKKVFEKHRSDELQAKVYFSLYAFMQNWKVDVKEIYPKLLEGFQVGSQVGEIEYAAWCLSMRSGMSTLSGENLAHLEVDLLASVKYCKNLQQIEIIAAGFLDYTQWWLNKGSEENDPLINGFIDKKAPAFIQEKYWTALAEHDLVLGIMYFYHFQFEDAWSHFSRGWDHHDSLTGLFYFAQLAFYRAWCAIKLVQEKRSRFSNRELTKIIKDFRKWGEYSEANHGHKLVLFEAELAILKDDKIKAFDLFDKAILQAGNTSHPNDQALFCEMTSRHYRNWNKKAFADIYIEQAYDAYVKWGAVRKINALEKEFPNLSQQPSTYHLVDNTRESTITEEIFSALDVESIVKASQAISSEIQFDALMAKLLKVLSESAGAQRVIIMLKKNGRWRIEALKEIGNEIRTEKTPLELFDAIPNSIISYIEKTKNTVVLENAHEKGAFTRDPYFIKNNGKSVLGIPIIRQGNIEGIIYMDNHIATGVFTKTRVDILSTLSAQVAISLENANFISHMQALNKSYERFMPKEFLKMLNRESILDVKPGDQKIEEMIILFADIRNFTSLSEIIPANETFTLLNEYLSKVTPAIHQNNGIIDKFMGDGIIALFPNNADKALRAAVQMMQMLNDFNKEQLVNGAPSIIIGIGLHIGNVILGTVGTEDRLSTTVIGDPVNVASRLEAYTKINKAKIQVSGELVSKLKDTKNFNLREVGNLAAKGKLNKIILYEEYSHNTPEIILKMNECRLIFEAGIEYFAKEDFLLANERFETYLDKHPSDEVALYFIEKCRTLKNNMNLS